MVQPREQLVLAAQVLAHAQPLALVSNRIQVEHSCPDRVAGLLVFAVPLVEAGIGGVQPVVQEEGPGVLIAYRDSSDRLHGHRDDQFLQLVDATAAGGFLDPLTDRGQAGVEGLEGEIGGVHAEDVVRLTGGQGRLYGRVVEEHRFLDPRDPAELRRRLADHSCVLRVPCDLGDLLLEPRLEALGLATGGDHGGAHAIHPTAAFGHPQVLIPAEPAVIGLQLQQMDTRLAHHECVHLVPLPMRVLELKIGPHAVRGRVRNRACQ